VLHYDRLEGGGLRVAEVVAVDDMLNDLPMFAALRTTLVTPGAADSATPEPGVVTA
jgi:hypothetical protein